ncbi:SIMPL domain-containing protein [Mobilitalea sibirica]|uniref:SIMPL domain-containing protein n=1 Tax=Mobilitalea sibirica TaxID=1462919 RepID=A0A8J7L076_9FIRM|nr:SIMPL domain-containing protein [Mobilitalea sibirica]MBH1941793.1 SIMPL domain-containing protein [Mobilitalea sibirica]
MKTCNENCQTHNTMTLIGKGQVTALPDIAIVRLGVQTNGTSLTELQQENAELSQAILQALRQMGVTDIKTDQYTIDRVYDYDEGVRVDRGYSVRNIFEITLSDMSMVGPVIDTAVNYGANLVEFISFEISNTDFYYQQALNLAILNAFEKAKSIAENSLQTHMDPKPIQITENSTQPIPFRQYNTAREGSYTTPVEPGKKQIEASVTVEFVY